jgi:hypothetical protein
VNRDGLRDSDFDMDGLWGWGLNSHQGLNTKPCQEALAHMAFDLL